MKLIHDRPGTVDLEEFLSRPLFAHLATASEEGPRESPVWFLGEDGAVWIIGSRRDDCCRIICNAVSSERPSRCPFATPACSG
jgi:hypothetical protein